MMKKIVVLFFGLLSILCYSQNSDFEIAKNLYDQGKNIEAAVYFKKLTNLEMQNSDYQNYSGLNEMQLKNYEKATEHFRLAALYCNINDKERLSSYYTNLCVAYSQLQGFEKPYQYAMKAYELLDSLPINLWNAVSTSINFGKSDQAIKLLNNSKIQKNNAFNSLYGRAYYDKKDYKNAIKFYDTFFENYEADDDFFSLNIEVEESKYLYAALFAAAQESNEIKGKMVYQNRVIELLKKDTKDASQNDLLQYFINQENLSNQYGFSRAFTLKLFHALIINPKKEDEERVIFLYDEQPKAVAFTNDFFKRHSSNELISNDNSTSQYVFHLFLFCKEMQRNGEPNPEDFQELEESFSNIQEMYSLADLKIEDKKNKYLMSPIIVTFQTVKEIVPNEELQRKLIPYLQKLMNNIPSKSVKSEVIANLKKGLLKY